MRKGTPSNEQLPAEDKFIDDMRTGISFKDASTIHKPSASTSHLPASNEVLTPQENYARMATQKSVSDEVKEKFALNVSPAKDDRPYFYQFDSYPRFPLAPGGFLFYTCCLLLVGMIIFVSKFSIFRKKEDRKLLALSGGLGFAYGILEIALLNAFTIAFSSMVWNFSLMVFGLLSGSALAGLLGNKMNSAITKAFIAFSGLVLISLFFIDFKSYIILHESQYERALILIGVSLLISFGASLAYPALLKNSEGADPRMPAFILGINSGFFILGSIVCRYLALVWGLQHTFFIAGIIYLCVVFLLPKNKRPVPI
jgi:hypothetical protein